MKSSGLISPYCGLFQRISSSKPHQPCRPERHLRLVDQRQFVAFQREAQRHIHLRAAGGVTTCSCGVEGFDAVAAALLGLVHRGIGVAYQLGRRAVRRRAAGDADAGMQLDHDVVDHDRLGQRCAAGCRPLARCSRCGVGQDHEFVAAEARHHVLRRQFGLNAARQLDQAAVADVMAMGVVDALEEVEVEVQHGERCGGTSSSDMVGDGLEQ